MKRLLRTCGIAAAVISLAPFLQACGEYGAVDCYSQKTYDRSLADVLGQIDDRYPGQSRQVRQYLHEKSKDASMVKEVCNMDAEHLAALVEKRNARGTMEQIADSVSSSLDEAGKAVKDFFSDDDDDDAAGKEQQKPAKPNTASGAPKSEIGKEGIKTYTVPRVDCRYGDFYQKSLDAIFRDLGARSPSASLEVKKRLKARNMESGRGNAMDQELCDKTTREFTAFLAPDLVNGIDWSYKTDSEVFRDSWTKAGEDLENALNEAGKSIDNALTEAGDALESGWNSMRDGVDSYFEQRRADKEKAKKEEEAGKKEDQKR
jgi:hypothetical protein